MEDEETLAMNEMTAYYSSIPAEALSKENADSTVAMTYLDAVKLFEEKGFDEPDPADYGVWVPGVPVLVGNLLEKAGAAEWLSDLSTTVSLPASVQSSASFLRCSSSSCFLHSLRLADTWPV